MAYCPNCEYEYRSDITVCPDCNEKLVPKPSLTTSAVSPDDSWVLVCALRSNTKADKAKGALDTNNIPSVIMSSAFDGSGHGAQETELAGAGAEASLLLVPREYREEAEIIVEVVLGDDFIPLEEQ